MTSETSSLSEQPLDVSMESCKRLLLMGYEHYDEAMKGDHKIVASYWDGYIRAIQHIIEMDGQ